MSTENKKMSIEKFDIFGISIYLIKDKQNFRVKEEIHMKNTPRSMVVYDEAVEGVNQRSTSWLHYGAGKRPIEKMELIPKHWVHLR